VWAQSITTVFHPQPTGSPGVPPVPPPPRVIAFQCFRNHIVRGKMVRPVCKEAIDDPGVEPRGGMQQHSLCVLQRAPGVPWAPFPSSVQCSTTVIQTHVGANPRHAATTSQCPGRWTETATASHCTGDGFGQTLTARRAGGSVVLQRTRPARHLKSHRTSHCERSRERHRCSAERRWEQH
jgi:hypothetical protein